MSAAARRFPEELGRTVLVVDDDEGVRSVVTAQLRSAGFTVSAVSSGEEAIAVSEDLAPHVVVLDLYMSGMDGVEVCRRIKGRADAPYVAVVMLSASNTRTDVLAGLEAGADDFLTKPMSMTELRVRVANLATVTEYHRLAREERDAALRRVEELSGQLLQAEKLASVGTLTAGICHELDNIGSVLSSTVEELESAGLTGYHAEALGSLGLATKHVHALTRSLLRVVRPSDVPRTSVSFPELAGEVLTMLRLTGRTKFVDVRVDCPGPALVRADRVQVQQVLLNLVGNAADALREQRFARVDIVVRDVGDRCEVVIQDNGPGMTKEVAARVYEPFFTTKAAGEGTGLGLSVVRRIVEGWDSKLVLETEPEKGAKFTFRLPKP